MCTPETFNLRLRLITVLVCAVNAFEVSQHFYNTSDIKREKKMTKWDKITWQTRIQGGCGSAYLPTRYKTHVNFVTGRLKAWIWLEWLTSLCFRSGATCCSVTKVRNHVIWAATHFHIALRLISSDKYWLIWVVFSSPKKFYYLIIKFKEHINI